MTKQRTITDEPVAIIAKRSEWAGLLCELRQSDKLWGILKQNPETLAAASSQADTPQHLVDNIAIIVVDTQLRIEKDVPPQTTRVKILKSESLMRSAWEVE